MAKSEPRYTTPSHKSGGARSRHNVKTGRRKSCVEMVRRKFRRSLLSLELDHRLARPEDGYRRAPFWPPKPCAEGVRPGTARLGDVVGHAHGKGRPLRVERQSAR